MLPRNFEDSKLIPVNWKRKLSMAGSHIQAFVRPDMLAEAVEKLKELKNPHYVNIDVNIDVRCVSLPKLTRKVTNACPPRKLTKKKKRIVWNNFVVDTSDSSESDMD